MYNRFMRAKEINVKIGDNVEVQGHPGTVTEVIRGITKTNEDFTEVRVHFTDHLANYGQYQDQVYGGFEVTN